MTCIILILASAFNTDIENILAMRAATIADKEICERSDQPKFIIIETRVTIKQNGDQIRNWVSVEH